MASRLTILLLVVLSALQAPAKQLEPATVAAFDQYVELSEKRINSGISLWIDGLPPEQRNAGYFRLRGGEVLTRKLETTDAGRTIPVPNALIHHWIGAVFIPGTTLEKTLKFLQDYDDQSKYYAPEVENSKLLSQSGNDFKVYLRLREKKVVTVVLDTEYDVRYRTLGNDGATARSYSTRIAEVLNPGEADESERPVGDDNGFMWRLNSYWTFLPRDGGVFVQLEAISLTRDVPMGLGWLIRPFISSIPKESLAFTLMRTRQALSAK